MHALIPGGKFSQSQFHPQKTAAEVVLFSLEDSEPSLEMSTLHHFCLLTRFESCNDHILLDRRLKLRRKGGHSLERALRSLRRKPSTSTVSHPEADIKTRCGKSHTG